MQGLVVEDLWKRFGGNQVLTGLDVSIPLETTVGLVAMNGAGKTTLINMLFAVYPKDRGRFCFRGLPLPVTPYRIAAAGLARAFQNARMPISMTVGEAIRAVLVNRYCAKSHLLLGKKIPGRILEEEQQLLTQFGLTAVKDRIAGSVPFGIQRKVDIARAVATGAEFLCLDEPAAGLADSEEEDLAACIRGIRAHGGYTVLVIDHRIDFLKRIVDRALFLHEGKIALDSLNGGLDAMWNSPLLRAHYLTQGEASARSVRKSASQKRRETTQQPAPTPIAVQDLVVNRGRMPVIRSVSYSCNLAKLSALVGSNGGGKSSLLGCMAGILPRRSGEIFVDGVKSSQKELLGNRSIVMVPDTAAVFPELTVEENLRLGLPRASADRCWPLLLRSVTDRYPQLGLTLGLSASVLSGGERKMLALARAMISRPRVLLADDPSAGLAPSWVGKTYDTLRDLVETGVSVLVTESAASACQPNVDRLTMMERGQLVELEMTAALQRQPEESRP